MIYKAILINKSEVWLAPEEYKKIALAISQGIEFVILEREIVNVKYIVHLLCEKDEYAPKQAQQKELEDINTEQTMEKK